MQPQPSFLQRWLPRLLAVALIISLIFNAGMYMAWKDYYENDTPPVERYESGDRTAAAKIAVIKIHGTIMPPFTERWIKIIERARDDDDVQAVLLDIDSPGGLVADSDQIYHKLRELNAKKPVAVSMKRIAASGGYYIAMGAGLDGRIFAEETTWTGSIGVIIPRYDATALAQKIGIDSDPLKTGPLKDALNPFRDMTAEERTVWEVIMDDAFQRFLRRIVENRKAMTMEKLKPLATGQIFTAEQAVQGGLVDEIGSQEKAIAWLKEQKKLTDVRVITYEQPGGLLDLLIGSAAAQPPATGIQQLVDLTIPRAMYLCSWLPAAATAGGR